MGKVKSWMMEMEEQVDDALAYVQKNMGIIDKSFVLKYAKERLGVTKKGYNVWD